jgi:hypothetical protein
MKKNKDQQLKELRSQVYWLKREVDGKQDIINVISDDLYKYRQFVIAHFKNLAECANSGSTPTNSWSLKQVTQLLNRVKSFSW